MKVELSLAIETSANETIVRVRCEDEDLGSVRIVGSARGDFKLRENRDALVGVILSSIDAAFQRKQKDDVDNAK